ncbi:MAG: hypothetical protein IPK74_17345 [Deltaproteobacteria bacterium]|nr:hypothetical protein [Deltaproteobacteria bacterium]
MTERLWRALVVALATVLTLTVGGPAHAIEYEIFIDVDDDDDLYELYTSGQISEGTYDTLVDLMRRGTDLDTAAREDLYALPNLTYVDVDRILAYRAEAGHIHDPAALVTAGVLSELTLSSIAAFLTVGEVDPRKAPVNGSIRYQTVWTVGDNRAPPMVLQARVNTLQHLTLGMAGFLTHNRLGPVAWDPNRDALSAEIDRPRVRLPKAFIQWDTPEYGVILGSYRVGFGQRLTFDNSGRYTPNGFFLDDSYLRRVKLTRLCKESTGELDGVPCDTSKYGSPDYRFRYGLLGVAAGAKHISLPKGWLQLYGFFSFQPRDIYQYQVYDTDRCSDPTDSDNPDCSAPPVFKRRDPLLAESSEYSFQTLPNLFDLMLGGGNFSWFHDRRTHVGVTGYGAAPRWRAQGVDLDFRPYSPFPYGGAFGAVGADASWGYRWADLFVEVARSFDNQTKPGGGGMGTVVRHTATWDVHEIEVSARYYDKKFNNPFSRSIAAADQNAGLRASNEAGGRVRYSAQLADRVTLRTFLDVWSDVDRPRPQVKFYARADAQATDWFRPGLWFQVQDRDIGDNGGVESYCDLGDNAYDVDANGSTVTEDPQDTMPSTEPGATVVGCTGERYSMTARMRFDPHRRVWMQLQWRHDFTEDSDYPGSVRHDGAGIFLITTNPIDPLRIRMRWRYYDDDIQNRARYEQSVWGYFDVSYRVRRWFVPRVRYDLIFRLDRRDATLARSPNPEHWLWFEVSSRF